MNKHKSVKKSTKSAKSTVAKNIGAVVTSINQNQRCVVAATAPHHANRVGFFQFFGKGNTAGCAVLTAEPISAFNNTGTYFAVDVADVQPL